MVASASNALYRVKQTLYRHYGFLFVKEFWFDLNRKVIVEERGGQRFLVLFKRDFFSSYGVITGKGGAGESVNVDDFERAVFDNEVDRFFYIYPNNAVYSVRPRDIRRNSFVWENEADGRDQYLFPVGLLQRVG